LRTFCRYIGFMVAISIAVPVYAIDYHHGISYIEPLKYPPDFSHFDYTNPDAPAGGMIRYPELGTFDSFNNILDKGRIPLGVNFVGSMNLLYDRFLEPAIDENASFYCRLCDGVWVADDYSRFAFRIREGAYWHDGRRITADDVIFSFETYKEKGSASIRTALLDLAGIEKISDNEVMFTAREGAETGIPLAFTVGAFPILPEHYWAEHDITKTTVEPPLGSGPYRIGEFETGRFLFMDRVDDYWGANVPVNVGRYNFDKVKFDYFRDEAIMLEALKGDVLDLRHETVSKAWAAEYNFPAVKAGFFKKELVKLNRPWGMWWPTFWNLDRKRFQDIRVREALWLLDDFNWFNRVVLFGFYEYADSFFYNSPMAHEGLPGEDELRLLEPLRDQVPERVFTEPYAGPVTTGYGFSRENVKRALALFEEAGWVVRDGVMVNAETGEPFTIDFIFVSPALLRSKMPYLYALRRVGIVTTGRSPEVSNWLYRMRTGKFDGGADNYIPSNTPGLQLRNRFSSAAADVPFAQNWARIRNPAVDALIEKVNSARTARDFYAGTRALDRVLLWNFYFIPGMAQPGYRLVYWDKFGQPEGDYYLQRVPWLDTWWWDEEKAARVGQGMAELMGGR